LFAFLARRRVIHWFLAQIFADPGRIPDAYERYCWRTCQQPGAFRAPLAFVSGMLNDARAEDAYTRVPNPTLLVFGDSPRFSDPDASEELLHQNANLRAITITGAGDLPEVERPDATAAAIEEFLA
jgi:pimeloyl-ACP methyl ester carboxylesterase